MSAARLGGADTRLLRGYAPLVGMVAAFALMITFVPTIARERLVASAGEAGSGPGAESAIVPDATGEPGVDDTAAVASSSGDDPAGAGAASEITGRTSPAAPRTRTSGPAASSAAAPRKGEPAGAAAGCAGAQVPGDPYSPPCIAFSGSNGGATAPGVSGATIRVSARRTAERGYEEALARLSGEEIRDTPEDVLRTTRGLIDYFNRRFQFYGRTIELVDFQGRGGITNELTGSGQEAANADAIKAKELGVFADVTAVTPPYADALAKQQIVALGAPYTSRRWFTERRPYAWSTTPDCSVIAEHAAEYFVRRLVDRPASHAGPAFVNQRRKIAVIAPENPWYQECVDDGVARMRKSGKDLDARFSYQLSVSTLSNQAASLIARLKAAGITTVACGCDPVLPVYLTAKAREQGYEPEWQVMGIALTDTDPVGQLYDQSQWRRAFGTTSLGPALPKRGSLGYFAYKSVRDDEPASSVDQIYAQLHLLATGIHMAGPTLTPSTFERGLFAYPGGTGPAGTVRFGPGDYTPADDAMEIFWDPEAVSPNNGKKGAYRTTGRRHRPGEWPAGDPVAPS